MLLQLVIYVKIYLCSIEIMCISMEEPLDREEEKIRTQGPVHTHTPRHATPQSMNACSLARKCANSAAGLSHARTLHHATSRQTTPRHTIGRNNIARSKDTKFFSHSVGWLGVKQPALAVGIAYGS